MWTSCGGGHAQSIVRGPDDSRHRGSRSTCARSCANTCARRSAPPPPARAPTPVDLRQWDRISVHACTVRVGSEHACTVVALQMVPVVKYTYLLLQRWYRIYMVPDFFLACTRARSQLPRDTFARGSTFPAAASSSAGASKSPPCSSNRVPSYFDTCGSGATTSESAQHIMLLSPSALKKKLF